jgi:hypothetical protein
MSLDALIPQRRMVASTARAAAIAEEVAEKHAMAVSTVLCARWDRYAVAARAELASRLSEELHWPQRRIGGYIGCTQPNVRKLFDYHKIAVRRAMRALPTTDFRALAAINADALRQRTFEAEERAQFLQSELERLTGKTLAGDLAEALGLARKLRCAIVLAILVEAFPRRMQMQAICGLYAQTRAELNYGQVNEECSSNLIAKHFCDLNAHFHKKGWPRPAACLTFDGNSARRLTDSAAEFLAGLVGAPRLSQLERARCGASC